MTFYFTCNKLSLFDTAVRLMLEGLLKHGATAACTVNLTNLVPNSSKTVQGSVSASLLHLRCLYPGIDTTENTKYDEYSTKWRSRRRHSLVSTISHHLVERLSRIPPGTGPLVAMQIDLSSKGARNLSVLQKIDSNFIEIVAEASDTAIYRFDPANTKWERFGAQGAVFITKNRQAPFHSLIILNKLGTKHANSKIAMITQNLFPIVSLSDFDVHRS